MPSAYGSSASKNRSGIICCFWCQQHIDFEHLFVRIELQKTAADFPIASDATSIWIKRLKKPQRNYLLMPSAYGSSASKQRIGILYIWCHQHTNQELHKTAAEFLYRLWCHQHMDQAPQKTAAEFSVPPLMPSAHGFWTSICTNRASKNRSGFSYSLWCHQHMDQAPQKTAAELSTGFWCHQHMDQAPQKTAAELSVVSDAISIWIKRLKKPQRNYLLFLMPAAHRFWTTICTNRASKNRSGIFCCFWCQQHIDFVHLLSGTNRASQNRSGIICCFWCHQHMDQAPQKTAAEFSYRLWCHQHIDFEHLFAPQKTAAELSVRLWCHQHMDQAPQKTAAEFSTASDAISIWIKRLKKRNYLQRIFNRFIFGCFWCQQHIDFEHLFVRMSFKIPQRIFL